MSKKQNTLVVLEAALERIIQGQTKRIPETRKLSVRAVEEEANLGNGSGYYYSEFVEKVKQVKAELNQESGTTPRSDVDSIREKLNNQQRIKEKFRDKNEQLQHYLSQLAAKQHHLRDALRKTLARVDELEQENTELRESLAKAKRAQLTSIK
jgi:predicted RNase H-like nuclease (RuvC/YqgF family)